MDEEKKTRLLWRGNETIETILGLIQSPVCIEIDLPMDYHHALFSKLNPDAEQGSPEVIDISGGPELLERIAVIKGLEYLKILVTRLSKTHTTIQLSDPARIMISVVK
jgi:hypothetical protein